MTPEIAMMYSRLMMGVISPQNIVIHKDGSWYEPAITDLLRQVVNYALSEAIEECNQRATVEGIAQDCAKAIEALKLPRDI